jgi:tetratricopeptide (TPR) repeat protein
MPLQFAGSDLLLTQLLAGDVGGAQAAWPSLWKRADEATGWTVWLIAGRLVYARAEIALHAEGPEAGVEWASRAIEIARRTLRRKYEALSLSVLGQAYAALGRREDALEASRAAVVIADELVGPPGRWHARAGLGEVAYQLGDDETAAGAYESAAALIDRFAQTLAPERAAKLLAAPTVVEILSRAGPTPSSASSEMPG